MPDHTPNTSVAHGRQRLSGRDPDEAHRSATPLELLFDLTFVVAFGIAANELARYVAEGHVWTGIAGFAFASFAVAWAWINYSWFASAYDTDEWVVRLATMVQMVGVIVLALGLEQAFASIDEGDVLDNGVMVAGYVVMRVPMVFLWARAARDDPPRRQAALTYIWTISVAQVFWVVLAIVDLPIGTTFAIAGALIALELAGPLIAQYRKGGTPWHAGHIAERYGLLVIITLGEGIIGTVASINAVVHGSEGWTVDAAVVAFAGVGLIFATWWTYFAIPWADVLQLHRERGFIFGLGHIVIFASLAAIGGGLHVAAFYLEHETTLGETATAPAPRSRSRSTPSRSTGSTPRSRGTPTRSTSHFWPAPRRPHPLGRARGRRRRSRRLPGGTHVRANRDGAGLRDPRPPPRRGRAHADAGRPRQSVTSIRRGARGRPAAASRTNGGRTPRR